MKFSTKSIYGARLLLDMVAQPANSIVPLKSIAERQNISLAYLTQLAGPLVANGTVRSVRGARGGMILARNPEDISLREVIELYEGPIVPTHCTAAPADCEQAAPCVLHEAWVELAAVMQRCLSATTIAELAARQKQQALNSSINYQI